MPGLDVADYPLGELVALDGIQIKADDSGRLVVARDLTDDTVDLEDALDVVHQNALTVVNVVTDMPAGETRLVLGRGP